IGFPICGPVFNCSAKAREIQHGPNSVVFLQTFELVEKLFTLGAEPNAPVSIPIAVELVHSLLLGHDSLGHLPCKPSQLAIAHEHFRWKTEAIFNERPIC